eukprot:1175525-Prorocentrum_minimum.AAC.5
MDNGGLTMSFVFCCLKQLKALPPDQFERVLHPAFEEDELKLILVGGVLGCAMGILQQFVIFA